MRMTQILTALALLVTGGLWAKPIQAADAGPVAQNGTAKPWPFGGNPANCACAFCTGKASVGRTADHSQL